MKLLKIPWETGVQRFNLNHECRQNKDYAASVRRTDSTTCFLVDGYTDLSGDRETLGGEKEDRIRRNGREPHLNVKLDEIDGEFGGSVEGEDGVLFNGLHSPI